MTNVRRAGRMFTLVGGLLLVLGVSSAHALGQAICVPSTNPCQVCPVSPPPCPPPSNTMCGGGVGNNTFTNSTFTCTGSFAQNTLRTETTFGPANICIGVNRSQSFFVCPGTVNVNTNNDSITASAVAVPTLSVWGFGLLAVGLGALALRRMRRLTPATD